MTAVHSLQAIAARAGQKRSMACSQFEYVKQYETDDRLLPGCWIVLRLDGKGFTKCAAARRSPSPPIPSLDSGAAIPAQVLRASLL